MTYSWNGIPEWEYWISLVRPFWNINSIAQVPVQHAGCLKPCHLRKPTHLSQDTFSHCDNLNVLLPISVVWAVFDLRFLCKKFINPVRLGSSNFRKVQTPRFKMHGKYYTKRFREKALLFTVRNNFHKQPLITSVRQAALQRVYIVLSTDLKLMFISQFFQSARYQPTESFVRKMLDLSSPSGKRLTLHCV